MSETKYRIVKETYKTKYGDSLSYRVQFLKKFLFWTWWEYTYEETSGIFYDSFNTLEEAEFRVKQLKHGIKKEIIKEY